MQAKDVMTTAVATVRPEATVREVASLLLRRRISAVPVVDAGGNVLGIVSEGDLIRRPETGTERHPSWWLSLLASPEESAFAYIRTHGGQAGDIMTRKPTAVAEYTALEEVADVLERHRIKRVPVLRDGRLVGILSCADLLHGRVAEQAAPAPSVDDRTIRTAVDAALAQAGVRGEFLSVVFSGGIVHLWGAVESDVEKQAARVAAQSVPGVTDVREAIGVLPPSVRAVMWAE